MQKYYSIGEAAKVMGISVQTLRHYSKIKLLNPKYVNPETGYRYYTADQFHYIDRIKYLQNFGLSLNDIDVILKDGSVERLLPFLEKHRQSTLDEIKRLQDFADDIQWYIDYFTYIGDDSYPDIPYKRSFEKRYMVAVPILPEDNREDYHMRLNRVRGSGPLHDLRYKRQFALVLDFKDLMQKKLTRTHMGMYLKEQPSFDSEYLMEIPAGEYICFRGKILTDEWNPSIISNYFRDKPVPALTIANEYEDSLVEYDHCTYEVQILIKEKP